MTAQEPDRASAWDREITRSGHPYSPSTSTQDRRGAELARDEAAVTEGTGSAEVDPDQDAPPLTLHPSGDGRAV